MGGYVSALASKTLKPDGLFLMAPALYLPGYREQNPRPYARNTLVVFGWNDTVVPVANGIRFAQQHRTSLHVMDADHRFEGVLPEVGELFRQFIKDVVALN